MNTTNSSDIADTYRDRPDLTVAQIGERFGVSRSTVINRARAAGLPPRPADSSRIPEEVTAAIIKSYLEDTEITLADIAEKHGVNTSTVVRTAKSARIWPRPRVSSRRLDHETIIEQYKSPDLSVEAIAAMHDCSRNWVSKVARAAGLPPRHRSGIPDSMPLPRS